MAGPQAPALPDFSHVVATVAIVAAGQGEHRRGCTASVWAEASEPPLLLVTLDRSSSTRLALLDAGCFAVNLLGSGQEALALRFGTPDVSGAERFGDGKWDLTGDAPVLLDGRAFYRCRVLSTHPFGAHDIVVGEVTRWCAPRPALAPLVFVHGAMRRLER